MNTLRCHATDRAACPLCPRPMVNLPAYLKRHLPAASHAKPMIPQCHVTCKHTSNQCCCASSIPHPHAICTAAAAGLYATVKLDWMPITVFSAPLNHRLSPAWILSKYKLPPDTVALITWCLPPSSPSAASSKQQAVGAPSASAYDRDMAEPACLGWTVQQWAAKDVGQLGEALAGKDFTSTLPGLA